MFWELAVAFASVASQATPAPAFVQTAIALSAAVDYQKPALDATATLTLENRGAQAASEVSLLLNRLMRVHAVRVPGGPALGFSQEIVVFADEPMLQVAQIRVRLPAPVQPGAPTSLEVRYGGPLVGYVETGSLYIKDRIDPDFTILRRDAYAFPEPGVPSRAANRSVREPDFSFVARITVPGNQVVATGGALVSRTDAGNGSTTWEYRADAVPFLNIAIAPYVVSESGGIRVHALPDDAAHGPEVAAAAGRALGLLGAWYGPLDREPRLAIAEIPEGFGSQASLAGGIILDRVAFRDRSQRRQLYHELTHIWNAPDAEQPPARWNEGLATYLEYRLAAELDGFADLEGVRRRIRDRVCNAVRKGAPLRTVPFEQYGRRLLTDYSYSVGFLMFTDLEQLMGRAALDAGLRDYFQSHKTSGGRIEDLRRALERASKTDLSGPWGRWMTGVDWVAAVCPAAP